MRLDAHYGMLPERAFEKRGFGGRAPATLEGGGGKGGGGGAPSSQNVIQSNIPEYAKPYVMNMLGAAQNQLFQTNNGEITGFRPYQAYSTNPTDYFAGPSSLQQSAYNAAGMMQSPGQFGLGSQLAGTAGQQALGTQGMANQLANTALGYGQAGAGYGAAGQMYGSQGAQQANLAAQRAQQAAQMYGGMGARFGAQAAGLSPEAQRAGAEAAALGMQGTGFGGMGAGYGQQAANMAGMGFGAGQQFMQGVTDPSQVAAFMSPYQQQVTDVAKASAIRDAQMIEQGNRLAAARQGTYGGARQALASLERERNLATNLANIQAQGSQSAYDRALAQMQFGSNLGLQGMGAGINALQAGMSGAGLGLQGLGTALQGQQARLQGLQQAGQLLGQGMQGAQTGLQGVGQQIAGGQLGLQGTAQGIQGAQAGMQGAQTGLQGVGQATQAGQLGLQGAQAATQAGTALGQLGTQQQAADINAINLQNQLGQAQQQYQQNIINQAIQDYATAQQYPYMQLSMMSNLLRGLPMQSMTTQQYQAQPGMAQQLVGLGGTAAMLGKAGLFKKGGQVKSYASGGGIRASLESRLDDIAEAGGVKGLQRLMTETQSPEAKRLIAEKIREMGIAAAPTGDLGRNMAGGGIVAFADGDLVEDPMMQFSGLTPEALAEDQLRLDKVKRKKDIEQYNFLKEASPVAAKRMLERDPSLEQKAPAVPATPVTTAAQQTPPAAPAAPAAPTAQGTGETGLAAIMAQRNKLLGFEGSGDKSRALMKALEERAGRLGKEAESDRYLRAAQAFAQFGSTAGPVGKAALGAVGEFAKGEAGARKEQEKLNLEVTKMQADLEKAQRAEARGDLEAAEKFYNSAQDRKNRMDVANASANRQVELIERAMNDPKFMDALRATKGLDDKTQSTALTAYTKWESGAALTDPEYRKLAKAAKEGKPEAVQALNNYREQKFQEFVVKASGGKPGATSGGSGKVINYSDIK